MHQNTRGLKTMKHEVVGRLLHQGAGEKHVTRLILELSTLIRDPHVCKSFPVSADQKNSFREDVRTVGSELDWMALNRFQHRAMCSGPGRNTCCACCTGTGW